MKIQNKGFTLVELIVVITILAVLATIGFVSFTGYSQISRDSKRKADISLINKWLQVYQTRNDIVPEPSEQKVTIKDGTTNLLIQWYAKIDILREIAVSDAIDPLDNQYYIYTTNATKTKFQVLGYLENPVAMNSIFGQSYADLSQRYLFSMWTGLWVLLDEITQQPINAISSQDIDLQINNDDFLTVFSNSKQLTLSWSNLVTEITSNGNQWVEDTPTYSLNGWDFSVNSVVNTVSNSLNITCPTSTDTNAQIQMQVTWDITTSIPWATCQSTQSITLTTGLSSNTIVVDFRDNHGNTSQVTKQTILQAACPSQAISYRGNNNSTYNCYCSSTEASTSSTIRWSVIYTDDSRICRAAVHDGRISTSWGSVTFRILPGYLSYSAATRNWISSSSWWEFQGSYRFE